MRLFGFLRRHRFWRAVLGLLVSLAICTFIAAWPGRWTYTISSETTYVTGPLEADGTVDYVTALNERLRGNVTPETNANVLIWQALGPRPEGGANMPDEYFRWLGIEPPPESADYPVSFEWYVENELKYWADPRPLYVRRSRAAIWPWSAADNPQLAAWLNRIERALSLIVAATQRPDYFNPLVPDRTADWSPGLIEARLPCVQACRVMAQALCIRAMLNLNEGKSAEAWQDLLVCHRLGRLVARGGGLLEGLAGISIDQQASWADLTFIGRAGLNSARLQACRRDLDQLPAIPAVAERIDRAERFMLLDIMMQTIRQGPEYLERLSNNNKPISSRERFISRLFTGRTDWDPAFRKLNAWLDRCEAATRLPTPAQRRQESEAISAELQRLKRELHEIGPLEKLFFGPRRRGEIMGDIFPVFFLPAYDKVQNAAERFEQTQRNLRLAFALAAFRADRGRYPAKLEELVPKYLDEVPNDLFTGAALSYQSDGDGYLLYSVGPNGLDNEGRGYDDERPGDDIRVRMPVPEPAN